MHSLLSWVDKPQVQVATLLTVIGKDGREVYSKLRDWAQDGDDRRILPVLRKFAEYCQPRKNVPFERYKFNKRMQESGESYPNDGLLGKNCYQAICGIKRSARMYSLTW